MANERSYADLETVRCLWDVWDGALPMRRTEDQEEISDNVLFMTLQYGRHSMSISGSDHYYFQSTDQGWEIVIWTDFMQDWARKDHVGYKYSFNKVTGEIITETLLIEPVLAKAHDGIMIPDKDWARL